MRRLCIAVSIAALGASAARGEFEPIAAQLVTGGLSSPIEFTQHPTDPAVQFINEKSGRIRVLRNGVLLETPFLNIAGQVSASGEKGLLGFALPANYPADPHFYVHYCGTDSSARIVRMRHLPGLPLQGDPASEEDLISLSQVAGIHRGGHIEFGPDGMLYATLGDNASGGNGQNRAVLYGKVLRLDVSGGAGSGYSIPPDNPYVGTQWRPEIWAFGLRNPWKFSFDRGPGATGAMLIADVGAASREEIDLVPPGVGGLNFGWNCREGILPNSGCMAPPDAPFVDPIHDYPREVGNCVVGGYVYRGSEMPCNRGRYFYADYGTGRVFSFALRDGEAHEVVQHFDAPFGIASMGRDAEGELYILNLSGGQVLKIIGTGVTGDGNFDSVVNVFDVALFHACFSGPAGSPVGSACPCFDLDADGDVDLHDFARMQLASSHP